MSAQTPVATYGSSVEPIQSPPRTLVNFVGGQWTASTAPDALDVTNPATGEVLDQESTPIGTLTITQVREKVSTGSYNGSAPTQAGDRAEKK